MADDAQSSVNTLLGKLTTILAKEAQLVRSVHSEVQFIKDEMESMYGFLLHAEAAACSTNSRGALHDYQLAAWTKQVKELAYCSRTCVDKYVASVLSGPSGNGLASYILKIPIHVLKTLPARRRIASQIRELKVRVQEVGERRLRYGVEISRAVTAGREPDHLPKVYQQVEVGGAGVSDNGSGSNQLLEDDWRSNLVSSIVVDTPRPNPFHCEENVSRVSDQLVRTTETDFQNQILQHFAAGPFTFFLALASGPMCVGDLAHKMIQGADHYSVMKWFECITYMPPSMGHTTMTAPVISSMWCHQHQHHQETAGGLNFTKHDRSCLYGRKSLIFVGVWGSVATWSRLSRFVHEFGCANGSAVVLVTGYSLGFPVRIHLHLLHTNPMIRYYLEKASGLLQDNHGEMDGLLTNILARLLPDNFHNGWGWGSKMFMHFLYAKITCTREDLLKLQNELTPQFTHENVRQVIRSCFNELPSHCKSCLMYLTTFRHSSPSNPIRREKVARQWAFLGLLNDKDGTSTRGADRCFEDLLNRGFISSMDTSNQGKVKTFETPKPIMDFLLSLRSTSTGDFSYDKWGHQDEIKNFTKNQCLQAGAPCWISYLDRDPFRTNELVQDLLPSIRMVEVLDLQGCKGLKKWHLRRICNVTEFLKYLSIRNTDVEELPRVIENLNYLEMLDIRETKVRVLTFRVTKVKKLKHLLAGNKDSNGSFFTLSLPNGIGSVSNLEVLSHVHIPESKGDGIRQLHGLRLRKLGVLLHGKEEFNTFLSAVSELCGTLQSLSIHIEQPFDSVEVTQDQIFKPPMNLQSLSISGIKHELPPWIQKLQQLQKVTLQDTYLRESRFKVLGELTSLHKLRIRKNSCFESSKLTFAEEQFKSLKFLLIDSPSVTEVTFGAGAAPEAQSILWSYETLQSISGFEHLSGLKEFHLKGNQNNIAPATKKFTDETAAFKYIQ